MLYYIKKGRKILKFQNSSHNIIYEKSNDRFVFHYVKHIPQQFLAKGAWYAINWTKVLQTQTQMVGHVLHNKRENMSIVDLVISPSDHMQAWREKEAKIILSGNYPIGTLVKDMSDVV